MLSETILDSMIGVDEPDMAQKVIVASGLNGSPGGSPTNHIDPNTTTSPFAETESLFTDLGTGSGFLCTGTLINPTHALTAAHCLDADDNDSIDFAPADVSFSLNYGSNLSHTTLDKNLNVVDLSDLIGDLPQNIASTTQILYVTEAWEKDTLGFTTVVKNDQGQNPDNKYYLYYAHHDPVSGIGAAVADSITGPTQRYRRQTVGC